METGNSLNQMLKYQESIMDWNSSIAQNIVREIYNDLTSRIISSDPVIQGILHQMFAQRGKGVRPVFMAFMNELVGGSWDILHNAAVAVEAIHIASLIHDDMVDSSELRRGNDTLNIRFSDKISVLFGDYIYIKALDIVHSINNPEAVSVINTAVERMIEGEIRESLNGEMMNEENYLDIIGDKTASLFAASGELSVILSGVDGNERKWARELGESVGMAFQIIDDTLDFRGDIKTMGKPRFIDMLSGRMTLPIIHSLKDLSSDEIRDILTSKKSSIEKIAGLVNKNGSIEYANEKARSYTKKAQQILDRFGSHEANTAFDRFITMLIERTN